MKNRIQKRLMLYFFSVLSVFAVVVGLLFFLLFSKNTREIYKIEIERQATAISNMLSTVTENEHPANAGSKGGPVQDSQIANPGLESGSSQEESSESGNPDKSSPGGNTFGKGNSDETSTGGESFQKGNPYGSSAAGETYQKGNPDESSAGKEPYKEGISIKPASAGQQSMGRGKGGYGRYMMLAEYFAPGDVWILDTELNSISTGIGKSDISVSDLPEELKPTVEEALSGKTAFGESDDGVFDKPSVTVAVPIINEDDISGAVLLHTRIGDINSIAKNAALILLISLILAALISFIPAKLMANSLTKPLKKMEISAVGISKGDYSVRTGIWRKDEIGSVAVAIDDMAKQLSLAKNESEKLDKMRKDFVSNISHELRTPLTVIRGSLEAINDGVVTDPGMIKDYNGRMIKESIYLERLISDLLELSRLQNPDFAIEFSDVDLLEITDDVKRSMEAVAKEKNIGISLVSDEGLYPFSGDYMRLRQMLMVVVDNAVKFTPPGKEIKINLLKQDDGYKISVEDEGEGINPEDLPYIFERFYKQRSEENKKGSGLGLSISKQIAERHGVELSADNSEKGAVFSFVFNKS
jgi:signal transduction histidine kinase